MRDNCGANDVSCGRSTGLLAVPDKSRGRLQAKESERASRYERKTYVCHIPASATKVNSKPKPRNLKSA
jgi:uncharacterized protein YqfB (UPF0267 family)